MSKSRYIIVVLMMIVVISGCSANHHIGVYDKQFNKDHEYIGFQGISSDYTPEEAKSDCYVVQLNGDHYANYDAWELFVDQSTHGEEAFVRVVYFYTDLTDTPYMVDLYYHNHVYSAHDSTDSGQLDNQYAYLLELEGNLDQDIKATVLTDDEALTFDKLMEATYSNNLEESLSIQPCKVIMFENN